MNPVQNQSPYLFGKGILIACIDSGLDYTHPDFRNEDGSTRILRLWDQSILGNPPKGYRIGSEYTQEQINRALEANPASDEPMFPSSKRTTAVRVERLVRWFANQKEVIRFKYGRTAAIATADAMAQMAATAVPAKERANSFETLFRKETTAAQRTHGIGQNISYS